MEETKKLLGSVAISPEITEELQKEVKNIGDFEKKYRNMFRGVLQSF